MRSSSCRGQLARLLSERPTGAYTLCSPRRAAGALGVSRTHVARRSVLHALAVRIRTHAAAAEQVRERSRVSYYQ